MGNRSIIFFLTLFLMVSSGSLFSAGVPFSYCSNAQCRLITTDFFYQARGMPLDLSFACAQDNQYALTFDDGPSDNIPRLLEVLKKNNIKASFLINGSGLVDPNSKQRQYLKMMFRDGHYIANHSFAHKDLTQLTEKEIIFEVSEVKRLVFETLKDEDNQKYAENFKQLEQSILVLRPPFGNIDTRVDNILKSQGVKSVRWNADRYDWQLQGTEDEIAQTIYQRVLQQLEFIQTQKKRGLKFNASIMDLNHDWKGASILTLEQTDMLSLIASLGYQFVNLGQCLNL